MVRESRKEEDEPIVVEQSELIWHIILQIATREVHMSRHPHHRPSTSDTRQLLAHLIAARQQYSIFLREVANGERPPDITEKTLLKKACDETLSAWQAVHEAWRLDIPLVFPQICKRRDN